MGAVGWRESYINENSLGGKGKPKSPPHQASHPENTEGSVPSAISMSTPRARTSIGRIGKGSLLVDQTSLVKYACRRQNGPQRLGAPMSRATCGARKDVTETRGQEVKKYVDHVTS